MKVILPKSVRESQRFIAWGFPVLIGYGVVEIPFSSGACGIFAVCLGVLVVLTGWLSFGLIVEELYNDLLLTTDLALLAVYFMLLYYGHLIPEGPNSSDATVWNMSGTAFLLYAIWDIVALAGRDTSAAATAMHLKRFAVICFGIALVFFALGWLAASDVSSAIVLGKACRLVGALVWILVLIWWHVGRLSAAIADARR